VIKLGVEKKVVSIRLDEEFIHELRAIAVEQNRPLSNLIETVLKQYVESKKANGAVR
jgi:predicted transcriptional regulator